jgi:hypothetical protein
MPNNMRGSRGQLILKFLEDNYPKTYSKNELAAALKLPPISTYRVLTQILVPSGGVLADTSRSPIHYQYIKGAKINIWPPLQLLDNPQTEVVIKPQFDNLLAISTDYKTPPIKLPIAVIYAAIFCMEIDDPEERANYLEWLEATAIKLHQYYLAYRIIRTIQALPLKDRRIEKFGISNKLPNQPKDDEMSMTILFKQELKSFLKQIP